VKLYLTGFMGAGKTTVGRLLAERLRLPFVDLDERIEAASGATVSEIFARGGEPEFRILERRALAETLAVPDAVVALGGGTLGEPSVRERVRASGTVIWLNPTFQTLVARVGALGKRDRPLFRDEAAAFDLYRSRLDQYRGSDLKIDIDGDELPEEVAARIALRLAEMLCST
jgi:shikimate kinase